MSQVANATLTVSLSVSNRVLQKLALVQMKVSNGFALGGSGDFSAQVPRRRPQSYVFFLGQALSLFYVVGYSLFLLQRIASGQVPLSDVRDTPQLPFVIIGLLECIAQAPHPSALPPTPRLRRPRRRRAVHA